MYISTSVVFLETMYCILSRLKSKVVIVYWTLLPNHYYCHYSQVQSDGSYTGLTNKPTELPAIKWRKKEECEQKTAWGQK